MLQKVADRFEFVSQETIFIFWLELLLINLERSQDPFVGKLSLAQYYFTFLFRALLVQFATVTGNKKL